MSSLTEFRDHCLKMSEAEHKPECPSLRENWPPWSEWRPEYDAEGYPVRMVWQPRPAPPTCDGCNNEPDRALFARLAAEVDDYLDPHPVLFGDPA